jgi:HAE1 family hydrophobic/amphiphilic exporter-1
VRMPLAFLPEVDAPFIVIVVPYPNSNPTQVEKEIAKPMEEVLATLSGVKKMNATCSADDAQFWLEFTWGQDLDVIRMQVSEKVAQVKPELPAGIGEVLIYSFNTNTIPVIQARLSARGVDLSQNYELLESRVINPIRRVPGVARVDLNGVAPREIRIDLVLDRVQEHGVDVGTLIGRLRGASSNLVLGQVDHAGLRYTARAVGAFDSIEAIRDLPVNDRGLKLSEIAEIAYEEPVLTYGRHLDRQYAVALEVYKESTANTVDVVRAVNRVITEDINADPLLAGVELFVWEDQAEEITDAVDGLRNAGLIGGLLAVLVLYFFLRRLDSTLIVSLSIPFSVVAACGVMYFMGKTLNVLSMTGLMLGIGMLVDNAIVVLESIDRHHRDEPDPHKAALGGAGKVRMAVIASTFTTLIVFLPLIVGASTNLTTWLKEIGIAICLALVCSLFSSLTLIPLMSAHVLQRRQARPVPAIAWTEDRYAGILRWTLRHKLATFFILVGVMVAGLAPFATGMVKTAIFSAQVNERIQLSYEFADFHYKSDAEAVVSRIEKVLYDHRADFLVSTVYSFYTDNEAASTIVLSRSDLADEQVAELRKKIRAGLPVIPGVRVFFREDADEGGGSTYFSVKFYGQDSGVLRRLSEEAERRLGAMAGVQDVSSSFRHGRREIQVSIDRDKAYRLGLTAQDLSDVFAFSLGGMRLQRFNAGEHEVETWLALRLEDRSNMEDLKKIGIRRIGDRTVRLGDIATFQIITREQEIVRENRKVRGAVTASYEGKDWRKTRQEITTAMNGMDIPTGYSWSWDRRTLEQDDQNAQMGVNFLLAVILVYLLMASLFESLAQPFAILFSIVFALPGVAWGLAVTGTPLNLMAQIGLLILMGVVVNNGIVLLDHVNQLRRAGMTREEAIMQGGRDRLRPVLMTASTTIIGLLPLAFRGSTGGGLFYYPLARAVMGGLISSALLTLVALPSISLAVEGIADWLRRIGAVSRPRPGAASDRLPA